MLAGLDTGFCFALQDEHPVALCIWKESEALTSVIVLYELQRKFLKGEFKDWPTIISDISQAVDVVPIEKTQSCRQVKLGMVLVCQDSMR